MEFSLLASTFAEVAKAVVVPTTMNAARAIEKMVLFLVFIIAVILSSRAFLLKLLQRGVNPLLVSSMLIRVRAYADFSCSPNRCKTASSQDNSISLQARIYIIHTKGLNQCTQSAAIKSNFIMVSNLRICTNSCAKTYCNTFSFVQSVVFGIKITG